MLLREQLMAEVLARERTWTFVLVRLPRVRPQEEEPTVVALVPSRKQDCRSWWVLRRLWEGQMLQEEQMLQRKQLD